MITLQKPQHYFFYYNLPSLSGLMHKNKVLERNYQHPLAIDTRKKGLLRSLKLFV